MDTNAAWYESNDHFEIYIHAGAATKALIITPETDIGKMVALKDFINNVNKCKEESDEIPINAGGAIGAGSVGSIATIKGFITDDAAAEIFGAANIAISATEIHQFVSHFNNAKRAQKNAESLFEVL